MGSYTQLTYHVVFATKYRRPQIHESFQERLYQYIGGIVRANKGCQLEIGGIADHVHMLVQLSPAISVSDAIRDIKSNSSKWLREQSDLPKSFAWQKGYGAFTVSYSNVDVVRNYIQRQPEHHRQKTFEQEYIRLLRAHEITFQPEHLFEGEHHG